MTANKCAVLMNVTELINQTITTNMVLAVFSRVELRSKHVLDLEHMALMLLASN